MKKELELLVEILQEHHSRHETLLELEESKRGAIVKNDTEALAELLVDQSSVMDVVAELEKKRAACMTILKAEMALPEGARVIDIAEQVEGEEKGLLIEVRNRLHKTLNALKLRSDRNASLLKASVAQIGSFFTAMAEARTVNPTYQRKGGTAGGQVRLLDHTA